MKNRRHNDTELGLTLRYLTQLNEKVKQLMATLDQVLFEVQKESTLIDGVSTLVIGLKGQVSDLLSKTGMTPADQAKVDAIFDAVVVNEGKVASAVGTTPVGDPVPPVVPVEPVPVSDAPAPV